ncbi:hypothetical protein ZOSMA_21G00270 [Zostera marina]|uniref:Uncharacterized protein n=1 Tax=Zostera marina TaxID=29655 RepID=A0A0K9PJP5_ZOSMR|nr:hypothetical protein ZOSMA_21G00270 [Zostera marina]
MAFVLSSSSHVLTNKTITPHRIPTSKLPTSQLPSIASVRPPLPPLRRDSALDGVLHKNAGAGGSNDGDDGGKNEFYLNLGLAVRTLRQDMPEIFTTDLNYEIYRDDITFMDPRNTFRGIENYRLIFWALRFNGRVLFREIKLDVLRIWQPSENVILIRWNLNGVPRVPWEARGQFQGTSRYKLDRNGKIYEHKVDNLEFNFPKAQIRSRTMFDLVISAATSPSPNPTFSLHNSSPLEDTCLSCTWVELYQAVKKTIENQEQSEEQNMMTCRNDGLLLTC